MRGDASAHPEVAAKATLFAERLIEQLATAPAVTPPAPAAPLPPPREAGEAAPSPPIDYLRTLGFMRWYEGLLRLHVAVAGAVAEDNLAPAAGDDEPLPRVLHQLHRVLLEHPLAAKAAYASLAAEGRRFAESPEGAALKRSLCASPRVERAKLLWRSLTMGMLVDHEEDRVLPSTYLDNLVRAGERGDLEQLLGRLFLAAQR